MEQSAVARVPTGRLCSGLPPWARAASPISLPLRWPSCVRQHVPLNNVLRRGPCASATRFTLELRVFEASTIAPRHLRGTGMGLFIATKVGGPSKEKRPLGRWEAS